MASEDWMTSGEGHPKRWRVLSVLVVCLLVVVLDNTVLNIALPTIQRDLEASQAELVWAVDSYILVFASLLFTWGVLGDRWGRKRVLVIGLVIFGVASAFCAFAPTAEWLIAFRAIMGVGGAAVMPTTLAIITVVFPPHERGRAIGMWAGAVGAAVALGPVLGGLLLQYPEWTNWLTGNDWGSVFLVNVPIIIFGVAGILRVVPETHDPHPRALDVTGLVVSFLGLFALIYGIIHASETKDFLAPGVIVPVVLGIGLIVLFLVLEARSDHPSFDVSLFRNRGYAVSLTAITLPFFALSGITFTLPFYLQVLRGFDTLTTGLCFLPFAVGQLIAAPRSAAMVNRFGYKPVMTTGLVLVSLAMAGLVVIQIETPIWAVLGVFFIFGLGMGNVIAPGSTVLQNVLPLARAGAGSAVQNTVRQVGGALGVAVIGTLLATQYARRVGESLEALPPEVPEEAKQTATESVVATAQVLADAVAQGLPVEVADAVREAAFADFLAASHVTAALSLAVVVVAVLVVGFLLPPIEPPRQGPPGTPQGERATGEPLDDAAALTREHTDQYASEAAEEFLGDEARDEASPPSGDNR
jgi:DHA2 family multidrug resistance protein-like MFS transporter